MKEVNGFKNKNLSRPRKSGCAKRRRIMEHKQRVLELGVPASIVATLNSKMLRTMLRFPVKTQKQYATV